MSRLTLALAGRSASARCIPRGIQRALVGLAAALSSLTTTKPANAQLQLRWDAPASCSKREEVLERIRALAGASLDRAKGLSAQGKITQIDGRFNLTLLVRDDAVVRERVVSSESCVDLAGAAAVTLVFLLGLDVSTTEPPTDTRPDEARRNANESGAKAQTEATERGEGREGNQIEESTTPSHLQLPKHATPQDRATASPRNWNVLLRVPSLGAALGPLPQPSFGAGVAVGMRLESWRILLSGYLAAEQRVVAPDLGGIGVEAQRSTGQLAVCRGLRTLRFEIAPCLEWSIERMTNRGFGDGVVPRQTQAVWSALGIGAIAHWHAASWLAPFASVSGHLELSRPRVVIDGVGEIARLKPAAAIATIGLEWAL